MSRSLNAPLPGWHCWHNFGVPPDLCTARAQTRADLSASFLMNPPMSAADTNAQRFASYMYVSCLVHCNTCSDHGSHSF